MDENEYVYIPPMEGPTPEDLARMESQVQARVQAQLAPMFSSLAQSNLEAVKSENAELYAKYSPSINGYLAQVPAEGRTREMISGVFKLVKSENLDAIIKERTAQLVAERQATATALAPTGQSILATDTIPGDWKERAAGAGLTDAQVIEWCRAQEITPEEFVSQFAPRG